MAPNRKKKKPASNPARGFATTSTASKPKHDEPKELEDGVRLGILDGQVLSTTADDNILMKESSDAQPEKALCELTPEELESQLENSGLQILVENHGEKTKKDVSRQVSRIQTEKRLLRSQAEHLGIRPWLPPEVMQIITDLLQAQEHSNGYVHGDPTRNRTATSLSEDNVLIKLWVLKRLLPLLGFSEQRTDLALRHLLKTIKVSGQQTLSLGKESVWGFDESLARLALDSEPADLPRFDGREEQSHGSIDLPGSGIVTNTPATTPTDSRPESRLGIECPEQSHNPGEDSSLSSPSDSDSEAEPEHLMTRYLDLQSRLYEISPELTEVDARRRRRGKGTQPVNSGNLDSASKRRSERLAAKIRRIKSDLLFDEDKANGRWVEIRIDLAEEAAERKRLGVGNDREQQKIRPTVRSNVNVAEPTDGGDDTDGDDELDGMLGGFFTSLPDTVTDPATGLSIMSTASHNGNSVEIRDFGKWTGMSPRRILEESCKARWDFHLVSVVVSADIRQRFCLPGHLQADISIFFFESTSRRSEMVTSTRASNCNCN